MPDVGRDTKPPFAQSTDAVFLHQPLHTQLPNSDSTNTKLPPDPRPPLHSTGFPMNRTDMNQRHRRLDDAAGTDSDPAPGADVSPQLEMERAFFR